MIRPSLLLSLIGGLALSAQAATVSISFTGFAGANGTLAAGDVAGVVPASNWNNVVANSGNDNTGTALVDSTGAATTTSISWISIGPWYQNVGTTTGDQKLFNGYLDNFADERTMTFSGLIASETYSFYLYSDGDNNTNSRTGFFTMGGVTTGIVDAANTNFSGTYTQTPTGTNAAGNYTVFTLTGSTSYNLTFRGNSSDDLARAPLNGVQIVSIPETSAALLGLLTLAPALVRRRK